MGVGVLSAPFLVRAKRTLETVVRELYDQHLGAGLKRAANPVSGALSIDFDIIDRSGLLLCPFAG